MKSLRKEDAINRSRRRVVRRLLRELRSRGLDATTASQLDADRLKRERQVRYNTTGRRVLFNRRAVLTALTDSAATKKARATENDASLESERFAYTSDETDTTQKPRGNSEVVPE